MDLYLSNCLKAAEAAASKAASDNLKSDKETCRTKKKNPIIPPIIPNIGPSSLLDLPLGAKLPVIPGSTNIFYTTNLSEKLYKPSFGFNLNDPYCKLMETTYKSLHDPHLKSYFKRKDILKKLRQGGYITGNNKVVCSLKELNKYRQYLTTLKIDFERNYIREQKIIEDQMNKLNEERRACDDAAAAEFQQWLLQEGKKPCPHQDRLLKLRHLRMIHKELDKIENTSERRNTLQLLEEDLQHWDNVRRKLNLRTDVDEEWQSREMALLIKIGEEAKRNTKVDDRRRKIRDEINRKKQVMLHKRIAYHLQKLQTKDSKEETGKASAFEIQRQSETASVTTQKKPSVTEPKTSQEHLEQKPSTSSLRTSISDQRLLQQSRESKSTSQTTKISFDEEKPSFYGLLKTQFSPTDTRTPSLPEMQTFQDVLEPKHYYHPSEKKASFAEQIFYEPTEEKYGPVKAKRSSFIDQKFIEELLEAKYLYPNTMRRSFTDHRLTGDNLEPKSTSSNTKKRSVSDQKLFYEPVKIKSAPQNVKKTSFSEEESFLQLMEAITPQQYVKKTSFADQKSSQESLESRRSSQQSQSNIKVFIRTSTTLPPQVRDIQHPAEQKHDKERKTSHHSYDRARLNMCGTQLTVSKLTNAASLGF
ncbi:fibrous sheath-interacting protein 2-like [Chionomys nivalis]|uniref:fibrous sheath-interacting protein 2-like n=1 Tax=Chionomys nivalis TaxID=269649 RepID=UPI002595F64A|nr:fibrous sheath-interacting protein 2-like [Chionomys nivalis]